MNRLQEPLLFLIFLYKHKLKIKRLKNHYVDSCLLNRFRSDKAYVIIYYLYQNNVLLTYNDKIAKRIEDYVSFKIMHKTVSTKSLSSTSYSSLTTNLTFLQSSTCRSGVTLETIHGIEVHVWICNNPTIVATARSTKLNPLLFQKGNPYTPLS